MIRRRERQRWMQFLRSFWEGWNIVQRLVCHQILCIPNLDFLRGGVLRGGGHGDRLPYEVTHGA